MPETLPASMLATLLCAGLLAVSAWGTRRWGTQASPDPVAVAWRRLRPGMLLAAADEPEGDSRRRWFRRREGAIEEQAPETPVVEPAEPGPAEPPASDAPAPPPSGRPRSDHVPFGPGGLSDLEEEKRYRGRFRTAMRKTRDYLNRDVREAFGEGPVPEAFDDLEEVLVRGDIGVVTATTLSDELRELGRDLTSDTLPQALKTAMRSSLRDADRRLRVHPDGLSIWLIVGVNGTGKTTSIAKLANLAHQQGFRTCLAAADTFRAAAIDQLQTWGERVGVDVISQHPGADPGAVVFDAVAHCRARGHDLLIVDTAGRLHTRKPLMEELKKVRRVIDREPELLTECLLVLDATTGQNGISQARAFGEAVDVTGIVLAKLDGTAKGGIVFSVERELGIPVKAVGTGEKANDLEPFEPDAFVDALFGS